MGQKKEQPVSPLSLGQDNRLIYKPDSLGNRIVDFSHCGYQGGNSAIPEVGAKVFVKNEPGDATLRIQEAIDFVGNLPVDKEGFRGAVLLEKGVYQINGSLTIRQSGVVLRGSGAGKEGTVLLGTGTTRETVIRVFGKNDAQPGVKSEVANEYVPVNATVFHIKNASGIKTGDRIRIRRPSTKEWIKLLKMEEFGGETGWLGWKPGQRDIVWDRIVKSVSGNEITIDAPITTALDAKLGIASVETYKWNGRISQIGIENLTIDSEFDPQNPKDEDHRWMGITFENTENAWVRQVNFKHLAGSAVALFETTSKITVEDCQSTEPVSEIGGQRRYTFFTQGQQTLFQRCYAEFGYHDFSVGFVSPGPNAFVQCESHLPHSFSGAIDSWASGVLFDNVNIDGNALRLSNRGQDGQGAGWTAANSVLWQCSASRVENFSPPGAVNYAFGIWSQFAGDGYWENNNEHIQPRSLYYAQLSERIGKEALTRAFLIPKESEASSPTIEQAAKLAANSFKPALQLKDWIDFLGKREEGRKEEGRKEEREEREEREEGRKGRKEEREEKEKGRKNGPLRPLTPFPPLTSPLTIKNGLLVRDGTLVTGARQEVPWWRGSTRAYDVKSAKPHITRFVPGRYGAGLTDVLDEMTDSLVAKNVSVLDHNYGLWYDRRRDDHERTRRMDAEVWAPFYEQPFARGGQGSAWDNLSKYDLTKYNAWYWDRLQQFATLADQKGLILFHQNYFQHNILEAGAHYADFPWRSANNINNTGFPEPPPYAGDKRIFMADQFYDIADPARRELHRAYIRKCLDNFSENNSVIQFVSAEYTGPLDFVKFWLDVIAEWEREKGRNVLVALSTTKDVQDAILAENKYRNIVDIIDIRYWQMREDGTFYAPEGGKNLAPRQHARIQKSGKVSFESVYQSVLEYRKKYPEKPVLYNADGADRFGWAVMLAGGSISAFPKTIDVKMLAQIADMRPVEHSGQMIFELEIKGDSKVIYTEKPAPLQINLSDFKGNFKLRKIDPVSGQYLGKEEIIKGGKVILVALSGNAPVVLWISKK
ncbi:DUF6298 domain-containing protein [Dyadobacter linearis]|uniref:DUF6298 domain-containing protein n=1 Tax=Dyadobacter linearis TaxID=2823330 RepID=UPI001E4FB2F3|nr:DUF6298 domain-containing protein [Dyadobacter sp. CECT 9623]